MPDANFWRPSFSDLIGIGAIIGGAIMWLTQPGWQIGLPVSGFIIALVIFAAVRHQSHPIRRGLVAAAVVGIYAWLTWQPIWKSFRLDYPTIAFQWPVTFSSNEDVGSQEQLLAPTGPTVPLDSLPVLSRADRFIVVCVVPPKAKTAFDNTQTFKETIYKWGPVAGIEPIISDIQDGQRIVVEARTAEAKRNFLALDIVKGVTKVTVDIRRIGQKIIVSAYSELPKEQQKLSSIIPAPMAPRMVNAQGTARDVVGIRRGAISGNMKVSFQAARSIG